LLVLFVLALVALNVLAWAGGLVENPEPAKRKVTPPAAETNAPSPPIAAEPIARKRPTKPRPKRTVRPAAATTLMLTATRGDCWVEVYAGSANGPSLYSGTLAIGKTLRFNQPKLWLRLGAASHVDLVVNGRASAVPHGTVAFSVPA
jgi:Domain of unknown function (DUF4115)